MCARVEEMQLWNPHRLIVVINVIVSKYTVHYSVHIYKANFFKLAQRKSTRDETHVPLCVYALKTTLLLPPRVPPPPPLRTRPLRVYNTRTVTLLHRIYKYCSHTLQGPNRIRAREGMVNSCELKVHITHVYIQYIRCVPYIANVECEMHSGVP